ncbi:MAG TPA: glycoside hydrolase family 13 protein [Acidimicrobiales bacterium]|nr:glycoside hydrolase family 13 protein [Acidimicrobiales bacterium]
MSLLERPHHDGSVLYVENQAPELGDVVSVRARVPAAAGVSEVHIRFLRDGEPCFVEAKPDGVANGECWWRADVELRNPFTNYRFLLRREHGAYSWLNGTGVHQHEVGDGEDFRLSTFAPPPAWAQKAVVYEIFPDRFASSGARRELPGWAVPCDWYATKVAEDGALTASQVFGGDLAGIEAHLGHVQDLGPNVIYLTPFFQATSAHRYDAETFGSVDPLLGGNEALASLAIAAQNRGIRLLGDLTTNHSGSNHEWFKAAQAGPSSPERDFYYWTDDPPGYACWYGHPSLPKFNYASPLLWDRLVRGPGSVAARWLQTPYGLDGWRVDVANMTGRYGADDFNLAIARAMRATMTEARPDPLLIAEYGHDFTHEVRGDGWHGVMNYAGFTKPAWAWLAPLDSSIMFLGQPVEVPRSPGALVARTMTEFMARVPWRVATHHFSLLCSHDTPRVRTVTGDAARARVGAALLFTFPGIPMVFSGDEIGLEGLTGEGSRTPFPWERPESWDRETLSTYKALIALRKSSSALSTGGFRWAHVADDALAYLREAPGQRLLVLLTRATGRDIVIDARHLGYTAGAANRFGGSELHVHNGKVTLPGDGPTAQIWEIT